MNRTHWILCGVLVVQLALLALLRSPWSGDGPVQARALLSDFESEAIARIEIEDGEGERVALDRAGEDWVVEQADGYPADGEQVEQLLETLSELEVRRPVVTSKRYHQALGVSEDSLERRVRLWSDPGADAPDFDLLVGTSPNYRVTHTRASGDDRVWEVRGLSTYDLRADTSAWIAKRFVDVPVDSVTSLKLTNSAGTLEIARGEQGWKLVAPEDERVTLDPDKVDAFVRSVAQLWVSDPAGRVDETAQGFEDPAATVEIRYTEDEEERTTVVRIGAEAGEEEGSRYATRSGFDFAVTLGSWDVEKITGKTAEDLAVDAEEDTSAAG